MGACAPVDIPLRRPKCPSIDLKVIQVQQKALAPIGWSFVLALRSRGLGTCWTTLHLAHEKEIAALLGIPEGISQTALIPVAYYTGQDFRPARRIDARLKTSWNSWDTRRGQKADAQTSAS